MSDSHATPAPNEFRAALSNETDEELVASLNGQVGNPGWVSARGRYLVALHEELGTRGFDTSAVGGLLSIPGRRKFRLEGKRLTYAH